MECFPCHAYSKGSAWVVPFDNHNGPIKEVILSPVLHNRGLAHAHPSQKCHAQNMATIPERELSTTVLAVPDTTTGGWEIEMYPGRQNDTSTNKSTNSQYRPRVTAKCPSCGGQGQGWETSCRCRESMEVSCLRPTHRRAAV